MRRESVWQMLMDASHFKLRCNLRHLYLNKGFFNMRTLIIRHFQDFRHFTNTRKIENAPAAKTFLRDLSRGW